jgi:hypothetical protein
LPPSIQEANKQDDVETGGAGAKKKNTFKQIKREGYGDEDRCPL